MGAGRRAPPQPKMPSLQKLPASSSTLRAMPGEAEAMPNNVAGTQNAFLGNTMDAEALYDRSASLGDADKWLALGAGATLLLVAASRRSTVRACLAMASAPL